MQSKSMKNAFGCRLHKNHLPRVLCKQGVGWWVVSSGLNCQLGPQGFSLFQFSVSPSYHVDYLPCAFASWSQKVAVAPGVASQF